MKILVTGFEPWGSADYTYQERMDTTMVNSIDRELFDRLFRLSVKMTQEPVSKNRAVWCYTAAFLADMDAKLRKKERFHFMTVNLKDFSAVNRKFGHAAGDEFLYQVARYLEKAFQEGLVYRVGGVEFVVLLPYVSKEYARYCCEEVYQRFQEKWLVGDAEYLVRVGICDMIIDQCLQVKRRSYAGQGTNQNTYKYEEKAELVMHQIT